MINSKVAKRYARSLIELARDQTVLEVIHGDMLSLMKVTSSSPDLRLMLKNPLIHPDKKQSALRKIFGGSFHKISIAFLEIIIRKRREYFMENIAAEFSSQFKELKGITTAIVLSANGLDDRLRKEIQNIVKRNTNNEVAIEEHIDPDIIGGLILRFGDMQYDMSVARSLKMFRMNFSKNLYQPKLWKK